MRVKTDEKYREILEAAAAEFRESGYHSSTLLGVARRIGTSKSTIYNYFKTKDDLFCSVLESSTPYYMKTLLSHFKSDLPFSTQLRHFSRCFIELQTNRHAIAIQRLLISKAIKESERIQDRQNETVMSFLRDISDIIRDQQEKGVLVSGSFTEMSQNLLAILLGNLPLKGLLNIHNSFSDKEVNAAAASATRFFMRAYGVQA